MIQKALQLLQRITSTVDAGFRNNSYAIGEDLRKLGLGMTGAGWISFFIPSNESQKTFWLVTAGLVLWAIGVVLTAPGKESANEL